MNVNYRFLAWLLTMLLAALPVSAHHSYALFDTSRSASVTGTAAKLEWNNPHVFVWMYVPDKRQRNGYQLYTFETGSIVLLARLGWDRNAIKAGEKLTVDYVPLKSGEPGGAVLKITKADGGVLKGDPFGLQLMEQQRQAKQKEAP